MSKFGLLNNLENRLKNIGSDIMQALSQAILSLQRLDILFTGICLGQGRFYGLGIKSLSSIDISHLIRLNICFRPFKNV